MRACFVSVGKKTAWRVSIFCVFAVRAGRDKIYLARKDEGHEETGTKKGRHLFVKLKLSPENFAGQTP